MPENSYLTTPIAILISVAVTFLAIAVNYSMNLRARRVRATIDLWNSYNNREFIANRLALWAFLFDKELEEGLRWDFEDWFKKARTANDPELLRHQVTLNQVAGFYLGLGRLLREHEVDRILVCKMFSFAYDYWNQFRKRFYADAPARSRYLFGPVPFFE